jgi:hypothetical protein
VSISLQSKQAAYTPLLNWDLPALAFVADKVGQAVYQWSTDWAPAAHLTDGAAGAAQAAAWVDGPHHRPSLAFNLNADASPGAFGAWLVCENVPDGGPIPQADQLVGRQVYGNGASMDPSSIAAELCRDALAQFVAALRTALAFDSGAMARFDPLSAAGSLPRDAFGPWSGGVRVSLPGFDHMAMYLAGPTVARLNPPRRPPAPESRIPLTSLTAAVAPASVPIMAQLHPVELTLGQIRSLQVGDVVVLPHALEWPLHVVTGNGAVLCEAYLGRVGAQRSLELVRRSERPAEA